MPNNLTTPAPHGLSIREVREEDALATAQLSGELGYPVSVEAMQQRILSLKKVSGRAVFVALLAGQVVAWIDLGIAHVLAEESYGEISGFVVASSHRSAGIGAELLQRAEIWFREQGLARVVVRSRITREAAHRFYLREGYQHIKTSAVFAKRLS